VPAAAVIPSLRANSYVAAIKTLVAIVIELIFKFYFEKIRVFITGISR